MKFIALSVLATLLASHAIAEEQPFECLISSERTTYVVGDIPKVTVSITNKSKNEVVLIRAPSGKSSHHNFYKHNFQALDSNGNPAQLISLRRCDTEEPLHPSIFVTVPSGETFSEEHQCINAAVSQPGTYTVQFSLRTKDGPLAGFCTNGNLRPTDVTTMDEFTKPFERVPKLDLTSNVLTFTFTEKKP